MSAWLFTIFAALLLLSGIFIAWRFGWRDAGKGTRRCPKCWYDMGSTPGRKCPECGHEAKAEVTLHRSRHKWRVIIFGFFTMLACYPVLKWPLYQQDGPIGFMPRVLTFAFLPEISRQIRQRLPRSTPQDVVLAKKLAKTAPLWIWERALLANSFARMLRDDSRAIHAKIDILRESPMLGEQVSIALPALSKFIGDEALGYEVWTSISNFPFSSAYRPLIPFVADGLAKNPHRVAYGDGNLDLLRSWGATDAQMHEVLISAIACDNETASSFAADYLWRSNLTKPSDLPILLKQLASPNDWRSHFAADCLADIGDRAPIPMQQLQAELSSKSPVRALNACVVLVAMGSDAHAVLPELDSLSMAAEDNSLRDAVSFTTASIRGRAVRAARPLSLASRVINARGANHCHQIASLLYHSSLPAEEKARQLLEIVAIGRTQMRQNSAPTSLEYALVFLGKLGPDARTAVRDLIPFCEPSAPRNIRISAMDAIHKIGLHSERDASSLLAALAVKNATMPRTLPSPDPTIVWRKELLQAQAAAFDAK